MKKPVANAAPVRALPKRGELGEEAKNSLFINAPPKYDPAVTLENVRSGTIDAVSVLADPRPMYPCKVSHAHGLGERWIVCVFFCVCIM